ncbi:lysophospholipid acyltransferase family protein [uncultured Roseovarius sp.]|uniref:lysophospholipid acyltransferase family protein n=1 Tax=uncultured Roseovarius sp. TaxID=293344 RepID=UPI00260AAD6F|nr:lysophospholipid acyltransferase family protein [uncultured Roseovarius sp.]
MNFTWRSEADPPEFHISPCGWLRIALRGSAIFALILIGAVASLVLRLVEQPLYGLNRPWTPYVTQAVCRAFFRILGLRREVIGTPMTSAGAVVSNHVSWLDIFALNACKRVYFVSKSEVAGWPGIGALARLTGTVFIARDPKQARTQTDVFEARLLAGHKLLFFPEGSSTDGMRVLSFKSTLFQAFFSEHLKHDIQVQPVSVVYVAPPDQDPRFYGWWGDMDFGSHLLRVLAVRRQGRVRIVYHSPAKVEEFGNRKTLAAWAESRVRTGMPETCQGQ